MRVNPGKPIYSSDDISFSISHSKAVSESKFGWPISTEDAFGVACLIMREGFSLQALHCHLGSQITNTKLFLNALDSVFSFAARLRSAGAPLKTINIGGGFGVPGLHRTRRGGLTAIRHQLNEILSEEPTEVLDLEALFNGIKTKLFTQNLSDICVACEPGRYLISDAFVLASKVISVKSFSEKTWLILDGGINIIPTAVLGEDRRLRLVTADARNTNHQTNIFSLGGPLCYEGDVLMTKAVLPVDIRSDDIVLISDVGAYTVSRSTNFIRPRGSVVIIDENTYRCIWDRETYDDIFRFSRYSYE